MDLLVVSTWFPFPPTNGSKLRAYHLLKGLAAAHRIHLLTFAEPGEETSLGIAELSSFCASVEVIAGNPAKAPATLSLGGLTSDTPRAYLRAFNAAMRALVERKAQNCQAAIALQLPASLYLRGLRLPRMLEEVEVTAITQKMAESKGVLRLRRTLTVRKLAHFVRRLAEEIDHMTVVSEIERQALIRMGCRPDIVSVIPNGADPADLERVAPICRAQTVVYHGSTTYGPNLDAVRWFIADIWPVVRGRHPNARFIVTGSTEGVDLGTLPDVPGVEFTGFVDDVKSVVAGSSACVVPLRLGGGTRIKVLEALALGTPVVATAKAVEGIDIVPDLHALIANTTERFAAQVVRVFEDGALASRLRTSGRALVESRYMWPRIAATLSARIEAIAS
jgi:glycosyltransferase involved in cell wall biosynthesis